MFTASMWVCVCCDLDHILGISEASFLRVERALAQTVGHEWFALSCRGGSLWNSVGSASPCLFKGARMVVLVPSPVIYIVRLRDRRHAQLVDIMARRQGRCCTSAVAGQLAFWRCPAASLKGYIKVLLTHHSEGGGKRLRTLLKWTLYCPLNPLCLFSFLPLHWSWGSHWLMLRGVCEAEIGLYDLISSSCPASVNNNPCSLEPTISSDYI